MACVTLERRETFRVESGYRPCSRNFLKTSIDSRSLVVPVHQAAADEQRLATHTATPWRAVLRRLELKRGSPCHRGDTRSHAGLVGEDVRDKSNLEVPVVCVGVLLFQRWSGGQFYQASHIATRSWI